MWLATSPRPSFLGFGADGVAAVVGFGSADNSGIYFTGPAVEIPPCRRCGGFEIVRFLVLSRVAFHFNVWCGRIGGVSELRERGEGCVSKLAAWLCAVFGLARAFPGIVRYSVAVLCCGCVHSFH